MLKKAINHVIQAKRKNKELDEALKKKGYGQQLKRLGIKIIPCVFGEEKRIKKL